ncbi:MAG: hypothetical protein KZQ89_02695 [Candidatus Thiodiazotropha sp. (ex Lucinoma kastoroae)]|nr:hypothetical protein [Candidatus Thiodiazotropha sp. (ex Lucinoma kastoroae)]
MPTKGGIFNHGDLRFLPLVEMTLNSKMLTNKIIIHHAIIILEYQFVIGMRCKPTTSEA